MASDKRSLIAHDHYQRSSDRFDEYITALAVGLIAYEASHLTLVEFGVNTPTVQLVGLALLLVSAAAGLHRMETTVTLARLNADALHHGEKAGALRAATKLPSGGGMNAETGRIMNAHEMATESVTAMRRADAVRDASAPLAARAARAYNLRNLTFLAGLASIAIAKLLPALMSR